MSNRLFLFFPVVGLALSVCPQSSADEESLTRRWVYLQMNLQVADNVPTARDIMERAAKAGYNGIVLADYKLNILDRVPQHYFRHAKEFKAIADELGLEVIPTVASFGYSSGILAHNPNLAEGIPVKDAPFVVRDGVAVLDSTLSEPLPGGGFEQTRDNLASGWNFQDEPGRLSFSDTDVKHSGNASLRWEKPGESEGTNARVSRVVPVSPWRQYHASVWIRTQDYGSANSVRLFAMGSDGKVLSHSDLGVKRTQDWTRHHLIFNSLENEQIRIYCGTWGITTGTLWMDDVMLEETAFVNLLRRPGCPLVVKDDSGRELEEGKHFAELRDPKLGTSPWAGEFDIWHEPPTLKLLPDSGIEEGQHLNVSFYHTVTIYSGQVTCCLAAPEVFDVVADQVRRVEELLAPKTYFLSHDEIRLANWCQACQKEGRSASELLAENVWRTVAVIRDVNPDAQLCVWSDMFDPHHNARDDFYLVNGDLTGSWEGLPQEMVIVNWNSGKPRESLPFFGKRGHEQILAGFYDHNPKAIANWLRAGEGTTGVTGVMYTTWQRDFSKLEEFAQAAWGE